MALTIEWVRWGSAAADALATAIATAKIGDPLAPVTVVVPSNHVGVGARRSLARSPHGVAAVGFLTPFRLAELLASPALVATGRRPVSTPVIAAALRSVLGAEPGVFRPVAAHAATESALVRAYRELRELSEPELDRLAAQGERAAEVVRVCRATRDRLQGRWYDEQDLMTTAIDVVGGQPPAPLDEIGPVIVHLPQRLSPHVARFLAAVARGTDVSVIAGTVGDPRADHDVVTSIERLVADVARPPCGDPLDGVVAVGRTRIVTTSDADDEVRAAVRRVVDAVRTSATPLDRIAVLHASPEPYGRLVHEHLRAAGIPANGAAVVPLTERLAGRALLQLLQLVEGGFRRDEVFAWLASGPIRHDGRPAPVTAWERISREAGVVAGRHEWDERLARFATQQHERAERHAADPEAPDWLAERAREQGERAASLRAFMCELIDDLADRAGGDRPWTEHASWARALMERLLGPATGASRSGWPAAEAKAAERVERALDRLAALDQAEDAVSLDVFARTLRLELEGDLGRVGRLGEGVLVGSIAMGAGLDLDLVVVLGLAEGSFPRPVRDDSLLPDDERAACGGALELRKDRIEREHRQLVAALAAAKEQLLCVPRGDLRRSSGRVPSRWVLDIATRLTGGDGDVDSEAFLAMGEQSWLEQVPSFDGGLRRVGFPATGTEHRLRRLLADGHAVPRLRPDAAAFDPVLARGAEAVRSRRSAAFTRFDGNVAGSAVPSPVDTVVSATRMQSWAKCPFDYFLTSVLGVRPIENPEEELELTPAEKGNLVHEILEAFILEAIARPERERLRPDEPWSVADRARLLLIAEATFGEYEAKGVTGRPIFWRRDQRRIRNELEAFIARDDAHRAATGTTPVAAELAFGDGGVPPVVFDLGDGRLVRFRGKADRVDVATDGTIHVVDYKTGSDRDYTKLSEDAPHVGGTRLQLPVYAAAARAFVGPHDAPVRAEYWFCSTKGGWRRRGYAVTEDVVSTFTQALTRIVDGVEGGVFIAHPTAASTSPWVDCHSCDPDHLGVVELRRAWERKQADPAVAVYLALAEDAAGEGDEDS